MKSLSNKDYTMMMKVLRAVKDGTISDGSLTSVNLIRTAALIIRKQDRKNGLD